MIELKNALDVPLPPHAVAVVTFVTVEFAPESSESEEEGVA
jgi:hypothetical protein